MILLTGYRGFIAQNFHDKISTKHTTKEIVLATDRESCFQDLEMGYWSHIKEIWHFGAISDTTETDVNKIHHYNVEYTIKLFEKAIEYKIPVKYASSGSVYGNSNYKRLINPLNYYAMSKATIDRYVEDNLDKFSKIQGYRFYNVYGRHEDHKGNQSSPVHKFTKQAKETGVIQIFDNSEYAMRDFIWVDDALECMFEDKPSGIYDVGTGVARSFQRVAEVIADKYNAKIEHIPFPDHLKGKYQNFTCAQVHFDRDFMSIEEYVSLQQ
jgi:ADP-L-glycero-D-manno-heptose 6-epimerase